MPSETLADLITDLVATGPMTGFELVRRLTQQYGLPLSGREGWLYAALMQLEREDYLESEWTPGEPGLRRRIYRLPVLRPVAEAQP